MRIIHIIDFPFSIFIIYKGVDTPSFASLSELIFDDLSSILLTAIRQGNYIIMSRRLSSIKSANTQDSDLQSIEEEDSSRAMAVVNHRDSEIKQMRRYLGGVIRHQSNYIRIISKKNEILIGITALLLLLTLLTWFSASDQCVVSVTKSEIERQCLNQRQRLNCNSNEKKGIKISKLCEDLNQCLRDPQNYKIKQQKIQWEKYYSDIEDFIQFGRINSWWICVIVIIGAVINYFRVQ